MRKPGSWFGLRFGASAFGGFGECQVEAPVRGLSGFPLHADRKWVIDYFHHLDDSVWCPGGGGEARADLFDRLMVVAGSLRCVVAEDLGDPAAGFQVQAVPAERERLCFRAMAVIACDL